MEAPIEADKKNSQPFSLLPEMEQIFKCVKEYKTIILYPAATFFRNKEKIKMFTDGGKLTHFFHHQAYLNRLANDSSLNRNGMINTKSWNIGKEEHRKQKSE